MLGKNLFKIDILDKDSRHSGLSNIYNLLPKKYIFLILFIDVIMKGFLPTLFIQLFDSKLLFIVIFLLIGHNWSIFINLREELERLFKKKNLNQVTKEEMQKIIDDLEFKGSFADFLKFLRTDEQFYPKTADELLMFARDIAKRIDAELPKFFKTLPRKPYGVVPVPADLAPNYTGGRYSGSSSETTAGFYWVNTYNLPSRTLYTIPALTAHEAVPGHHLQISLNNELPETIPSFRRRLYLSAYGEGWGLYSEYLADEMNIYTTPYEKFGQLTYEMWRACRLVVDTGVHAKGWTRQQMIDYMSKNTALSIHEVTTETDRYISWPGQALSYKIGEIKIRELRKKAVAALGEKFDIREFHEVILEEGTVTLSIMEKRINTYIQKK